MLGADADTPPWNHTNPVVPTTPETAVPAIVAANSPITRGSVLSSNREPNARAISPATMAASTAFATAEKPAFQMLRPPRRFAPMVAAITPTRTGQRPRGPATIRAPEAMPAAGQNTATPLGF